LRDVDAQVQVGNILFGANFQEFKIPFSLKFEAAAQREGARHIGAKILREERFDLHDIAGLEIVTELARSIHITRIVIVKNHRISVSVIGEADVEHDPMVQHFFSSFKLLPSSR
jgi:hypothetical protein